MSPAPGTNSRWCLFAAAVFLGACAPSPSTPPGAPLLASTDTSRPAPTREAEIGLEALWWATDDSKGAVGRGLAPFVTAAPGVPEDQAAAWRTAGLRIFGVPRDRIEAMFTATPSVGPLQRQWFGVLSAWTPVISGRAWTGALDISIDSGRRAERLTLGDGRLRLLARCWAEPRVTPDDPAGAHAALRVEILPQHEESVAPRVALPGARRPDQSERGLNFDRFILSFVADPNYVYVIVPETPAADWRPTEEASNDHPLGPPAPLEDARGDPAPPTLGEAMLSDAPGGGLARTRIIVVLVPRAPERFDLIRVQPTPAREPQPAK